MKRILLFLFLFILQNAAYAQQGPVYGQYFHNPFLYNPGFGGVEMYPVVTLTHQRQFVGIEGAPVASTLVFETPLLKNIAVGAKIFTESQGLLSSSSGQLALVYILPFNETTNLRFGIAGGMTKSQLDLSSANGSQLEYLSGAGEPLKQVDVRFGMVLNSRYLKLGIAFPNMTNSSLISKSNYTQSPLKPYGHLVVTGTLKMEVVPARFTIEPVAIFERIHENQQQRIEGGALFYMKELVWVGSTYQYKSGISGHFGIKIKENASFGYSYGMNSTVTSVFTNASHEVQLKIKLGKEREFTKKQNIRLPRFEASNF